jgi:FAD/FMN-containing dehydrogenase
MHRRRFLTSSLASAVAAALPLDRLLAAAQITADVPAVTGTGKATVVARSALEELKASLRGALLLPGDPGYEQARHVMNDSIDKHPALVVQPTGVADIQTSVNFARDHDLLLAVKCGGHSFSGKSTCEGGMQIDLARFRHVRIDPAPRTAYVAGGSLLGELDHESMAFGLVTTAGTVSHTGVGGLTLGGGFGRVGRRFGLALDNVKAVDLVTANGELRHASAAENPDLYWGVRGGGGNFGVVTSFEFALHPMQRQVIGGNIVYPLAKARELLATYAEVCHDAPDDLYTDAVLVAPPAGQPAICLVNVCYSGPPERADALLAPFRKLGTPLADTVASSDYVVLQRSADETDPRVEGQYLKSGFIDGLDAGLIDALVGGFEGHTDRGTMVFFQQSGGAISRIAPDATAFPHRRASHNLGALVSWALDRDAAPHIAYVKGFWSKLQPHTDGQYTNELVDQAQKVVDANYQGNLPRLRQVKAKYDPTNLFRLNANVSPA